MSGKRKDNHFLLFLETPFQQDRAGTWRSRAKKRGNNVSHFIWRPKAVWLQQKFSIFGHNTFTK
jgi:hypothetical protein